MKHQKLQFTGPLWGESIGDQWINSGKAKIREQYHDVILSLQQNGTLHLLWHWYFKYGFKSLFVFDWLDSCLRSTITKLKGAGGYQ